MERVRDGDKDNDAGGLNDDTNHNVLLAYGHAAGVGDTRAISALIERYYSAALVGEGAKACTMLETALARDVSASLGRDPGPPYLRGSRTCRETLVRLFGHFHSQLVAEAGQLDVAAVRIAGDRGLALLSFGRLAQRQIPLQRDRGRWRIGAVLDTELP